MGRRAAMGTRHVKAFGPMDPLVVGHPRQVFSHWKAQVEGALMLTIEIAARRGFGMVSLR